MCQLISSKYMGINISHSGVANVTWMGQFNWHVVMWRPPDNDDEDVEKDDKETGIGAVTAPLGPLDTTLQWERERDLAAPHKMYMLQI